MAQRHHYVPEFYQKGFTSEGRLWKYDRRFHSYNRCYPKENCLEWDLYAVRPDNARCGQRLVFVEIVRGVFDNQVLRAEHPDSREISIRALR